jgi:hypothetical protein
MDLDRPAYFSMNFAPTLALVSVVRRFVEAFYHQILGEADASSRAAMATHELLENAVRHAAQEECFLRVSVAPMGNDYLVSIRTRNRALEEDIQRVSTIIDRVIAATDPQALYQEFMIESAEVESGSGLGLARIRAEGEMDLSYELRDNEIDIHAQARVSVVRGAK